MSLCGSYKPNYSIYYLSFESSSTWLLLDLIPTPSILIIIRQKSQYVTDTKSVLNEETKE